MDPIVRFGFWTQIYVSGTAEVIDYGFQMQLGREGYKLKVLESAEYEAGTTIYAYSHNVRKAAA
jgi:hypothetical protein